MDLAQNRSERNQAISRQENGLLHVGHDSMNVRPRERNAQIVKLLPVK